MSRDSTQPIYLAGPTASGKSSVALNLAERLNGEIISVDSMQVYRGLDIGTAKPSAAEQAAVRHHLIDIIDLADAFDAAQFVTRAREAENQIRARGNLPIYCGGTALYLKALFHGVSEAPPSDPELREQLERKPLRELLEELAKSDPATFEKIDRENLRRVVRALEVIRLSGRPFSEQQSSWDTTDSVPKNLFAFVREPEDLRHRIDVRVDKMFADGIVEETQALLNSGLRENRNALQAIGYRQVVEHLDGARSLNETIALVKTRTWQFSRRQKTWLRNQLNPTWVSLTHASKISDIADEIFEASLN